MKWWQRLRVRLFREPPPPPRPGYGQPGDMEWLARYDSSFEVRACAIAALEPAEKASMLRSVKGGLRKP